MLKLKDSHPYVVSGFLVRRSAQREGGSRTDVLSGFLVGRSAQREGGSRARTRNRIRACGLVMIAVLTGACDKAQLLAPTKSTITVSAPTRVLPSGGSTEVTAFVMESGGTPVQNGTTVRFTSTLGRVDPGEAQTRNGLAITTFFAGDSSGIAEIRASSGAATGGEGTANLNVLTITIGAAAVTTVTIRANPASVGPGGGSVELIATAVGKEGQTLPGIVVTFSTTQGSLSSPTATTNAAGEARTTLTTAEAASVTATAGTVNSTTPASITIRPGPAVTITCTPAAGGTNCNAVQASASNNAATVTFTVTRVSGSSALRTATIDFGDGTSQSLGNLAGGAATVTRTYSGPSAPGTQSYTATVSATDINGESASVSTTVIVTRPTLTPISVTVSAQGETATAQGQRWTFTAAATGGGEGTTNAPIESYEWDFADGQSATTSGNTTAHVYRTTASGETYTVRVTARTTDGRTAIGRTEILVKFP